MANFLAKVFQIFGNFWTISRNGAFKPQIVLASFWAIFVENRLLFIPTFGLLQRDVVLNQTQCYFRQFIANKTLAYLIIIDLDLNDTTLKLRFRIKSVQLTLNNQWLLNTKIKKKRSGMGHLKYQATVIRHFITIICTGKS